MKYTPESMGEAVRTARKSLGVTQKDLALTSGTGLRFIIDLEKGKPTCQLGKVLTVLHTLGINIKLVLPATGGSGTGSRQGADGGGKEKS
jgi:HTH-type transcriptional regulator/antitoxin HipB